MWKDIEELLTGKLASVLLASVMRTSEKRHHTFEIERLKNKIYSINAQVESLTLRLAELPKEVSAAPIYKQMEKLEGDKKLLELQILKLRDEELDRELPTDGMTYDKLLDVFRNLKESGLTTAKKQRIITILVERIEIFPDRLEIHYGLGRSKIKRELVYANSLNYFEAECSTSLTNGAGYKTRTCDNLDVDQGL